jgi:uncharacterized membrane protein YbaN (DUF454 family)
MMSGGFDFTSWLYHHYYYFSTLAEWSEQGCNMQDGKVRIAMS